MKLLPIAGILTLVPFLTAGGGLGGIDDAHAMELDHVGAFNFRVEIDGISAGAFRNVEGLDAETEVIEFQDADGALRKRPGRTKYSNITLKRGYVATDELWLWRKQIEDGDDLIRRNGAIVVLDSNGAEVLRYNFFEAWPSKWKGFTLDGKGTDSAIAVETIELAVERIERVPVDTRLTR